MTSTTDPLGDSLTAYRTAVLSRRTHDEHDAWARVFDQVLELCVAAERRGFQKGYEKAQQEVLS